MVGRKFTSVICSKLLLKLALRMQIFLNLSRASTLSIWTKEIQADTEEWTMQTAIYRDTFWLQSFGTRTGNSSLANAKIYVLLYSFCFVFWIWRPFLSTNPRGLVFGGAIYQKVFCKFGALIIIWRGCNKVSRHSLIIRSASILDRSLYLS